MVDKPERRQLSAEQYVDQSLAEVYATLLDLDFRPLTQNSDHPPVGPTAPGTGYNGGSIA